MRNVFPHTPRRTLNREKNLRFILAKGRIEKNMMSTTRKMKKAGRSIVIFSYTPFSGFKITQKERKSEKTGRSIVIFFYTPRRGLCPGELVKEKYARPTCNYAHDKTEVFHQFCIHQNCSINIAHIFLYRN